MMTNESPAVPFDRVVLVHGFGADVDAHWFPWLADEVPQTERVVLPVPERPTPDAWIPLVRDAIGVLHARTAVVTHSLGGITALRAVQELAASDGVLGALVAVAPFAERLAPPGDPDLDRFVAEDLPGFLRGVDLAAVRDHLGRAQVIRSDNDPAVPAAASDRFAAELGASVTVVPGAGHFLDREGVTRLDPVISALREPSA